MRQALNIDLGNVNYTNTHAHIPIALRGTQRITRRHTRQFRPIQHREFTGADAEAKSSNMVAGAFGFRGAMAHASFTQVWRMAHSAP
eukprot:5610735-Pyramimonas_sp.AAC.1